MAIDFRAKCFTRQRNPFSGTLLTVQCALVIKRDTNAEWDIGFVWEIFHRFSFSFSIKKFSRFRPEIAPHSIPTFEDVTKWRFMLFDWQTFNNFFFFFLSSLRFMAVCAGYAKQLHRQFGEWRRSKLLKSSRYKIAKSIGQGWCPRFLVMNGGIEWVEELQNQPHLGMMGLRTKEASQRWQCHAASDLSWASDWVARKTSRSKLPFDWLMMFV